MTFQILYGLSIINKIGNMHLYPLNKLPIIHVKRFIIIFYIVGILGFVIPYTKELFIAITPLALLVNTYLLAVYHQEYIRKDVVIFTTIVILGYMVELIGVHTGEIFGTYKYGKGLGFKVFDTPLLIGLNWLSLTYLTVGIASSLKFGKAFTLFFAPLLMLLYDIVLEQVAPVMNMWYWQNAVVPFKNYMAWYILSFLFTGVLIIFKVRTQNPLSMVLFISQFVFFLMLILLF